MIHYFEHYFKQFLSNDSVALFFSLILGVASLIFIGWVSNYVAKRYIVQLIGHCLDKSKSHWIRALRQHKVFSRLSHLVPAILIYLLVPLVLANKAHLVTLIAEFITKITLVYMLGAVTYVVTGLLDAVETTYRHYTVSRSRPIKSYLQVVKIVLYLIVSIITVSVLINKSPTALFTGLGALTAVTMLVFKDSILGFVASVQLSYYDMIHIDDWIEMPSYGADGDVIDISLNTIKVQNFDKTIVTIPTYALMTSGVKNWRGMSQAGGRRIKRAIYLDMDSLCFCDEEKIKKLSKIHYIQSYITEKIKEMQAYNETKNIDRSTLVNGRHLTNIGVFRAYVEHYLKNHSNIHQNMTCLVRQLQPTENGLPLEIYTFTNETNWNRYESIQADIFDHLLAILPEFGLRVFQNFSGRNIHVTLSKDSIAREETGSE